MNLRIPVFASLALALLAAPALAVTRKVPTEAYPTIQSAINDSDNGDKIVVAAGIYETGFSLGEFTELTIRFKPGAVLQGGTIGIYYADGITLIGITMLNPNTDGAALYATHANGLTVTGLTITGGNDDGIYLDECADARIVKSKVEGCADEGIESLDCTGVVVDRCTFDGNEGWGILLGGDGSAVRVLRNKVVADGYGISVNGTDVRIEKNTVTGPSEKGIQFSGGTLGVIQKNILFPTDGWGIDVAAEAPLVAKNTVLGYSDTGIRVVGNGSVVEKNRVTGAGTGIDTAGNMVVVTKNRVIVTVGGPGYWLDGAQATVSGNRAVDIAGPAFYLLASNSTMTGNVADGAITGFFSSTGAVMTKNTAIGCTTDLVSYVGEGAFTLTKNRFLTFLFNFDPNPSPV